jgi:hypothetical protein
MTATVAKQCELEIFTAVILMRFHCETARLQDLKTFLPKIILPEKDPGYRL